MYWGLFTLTSASLIVTWHNFDHRSPFTMRFPNLLILALGVAQETDAESLIT